MKLAVVNYFLLLSGQRYFTSKLLLAILFSIIFSSSAFSAISSGFQDSVAFNGLNQPIVLRFANDGRIFVAEKSGIIKIFDGLNDANGPDSISILPPNVHDFWDRGLIGLAVHPDFPTTPYIYVLYTLDQKIPAQRALGDGTNQWGDTCPSPPGANNEGCVVNARLSRLEINVSNQLTGSEFTLLDGFWCQQYPSHSIGSLEFGTDGALYISAGDGASFTFNDHGQILNHCQDPMGSSSVADDEGGALRSQDLLTSGDPVSYDGTILRIDPITGNALPGNPLSGSPNENEDRIIAHGLRNPFRFTFRPGTQEIWIGDVGGDEWEEINVIQSPTDAIVENFGWPCYEGGYTDSAGATSNRQPGYDALNVSLCEGLYNGTITSDVTPSVYAYRHSQEIVTGGNCNFGGSSSITGITFYQGGSYPTQYDGALFFADSSRQCIATIFTDVNGNPDPTSRAELAWNVGAVVDLKIGPNGDLFYVELLTGEIHRVTFFNGNQAPLAVINASPTNGPVPLSVQFDASSSSDPDIGDTLTYAWDLDNDGLYNDATGPIVNFTFNSVGTNIVGLVVSDGQLQTTDSIVITAGNTAPAATIISPASSLTWRVDDNISFNGSASDPEDGALPASAFTWDILLHHCITATDCHVHPIEQVPGVLSGNFVAPDHEYPSFLELKLTVTDSGGLQDIKSVQVHPQTANISFDSNQPGISLAVGSSQQTTAFNYTAILGSLVSIAAPTPQTVNGKTYVFSSWSDGGLQSHDISVVNVNQTLTANYTLTSKLNGTIGVTPNNVDLAAEGTTDWAHWGSSNSNIFNHKAGVTQQISNQTRLGSTGPWQFGDSSVAMSWSGGTPTTSANNTTTGVWYPGLNNGFQLTVPADTNARTLKLYVGAWSARGQLTASLSDGSSPDYVTAVDNTSNTSSSFQLVTLNYSAASVGQTLTITYTMDTIYNGNGNVTLQAATLVEASGNPPVLSSIGNQGVDEGLPLSFTISASDTDGQIPAMTATGLPAAANFVDNGNGTGTFTWNTTIGDNGSYPGVTFIASDGLLIDSETITITIGNLNQAPTLNSIGTQSTSEGQTLNFTVTANDIDSTIPTLSATGLPNGATFDDNLDGTGTFNWITTTGDQGSYSGVLFTATDAVDTLLTATETITISISAPNQPPALSAIGNKAVDEGATLSFTISATDPEGSTPSFSASNLPAGSSMFDNGNGTATFTWVTDFTDGGTYTNVTFTATDSALLPASESITITVKNINQPPSLNPVGPHSTNEGTTLNFTVTATDPDGTTPVLSATGLPTDATFTDLANGSGSFTWNTTVGDAGSYTGVTFSATDGALTSSETITVTIAIGGPELVGAIDIAPANVDLTSEGTADWAHWGLINNNSFNHKSGVTQQISNQTRLGATGPWQFSDSSVAMSWTSGTPTANTTNTRSGVWYPGLNNGFQLTVPADTNSRTLKLYVGAWSARGQLTASISDSSSTNYTGLVDNTSNNNSFFQVVTLNYSAASAGQTLSITYTMDTIYNGNGNVTLQAATLIEASGNPPVLTAIGNQSVDEGATLSFTVSATDPDGPVPALSASGIPTGAGFVDNGNGTGTFTWNTNIGDDGTYPGVTFTASDGVLLDSETITISVGNLNQAPTLNPIGAKSTSEGSTLNFTVTASDIDGTTPVLSATGLPTEATFIDNLDGTATFTWNTTTGDAGSYPGASITATDTIDGTLSSSEIITITVTVGGPELTGSVDVAPASVDLAIEGTTDWAHWGLSSSTSFVHKEGVTQQISNQIRLGSSGPWQFTDSTVSMSWRNGTPTANVTNTTTGVWYPGVNNGFQLTIPADTNTRTLKLYVGAWSAHGQLIASLSDASSADHVSAVDNTSNSISIFRVITLTYSAASAGQTLTIRYTMDNIYNGNGNVTLQGATLVTSTSP